MSCEVRSHLTFLCNYFQAPSPSDETPPSATCRVEADIEISSSAVGNQIENEASTSQLNKTLVEQDSTIAASNEGTKKTLVENNPQK